MQPEATPFDITPIPTFGYTPSLGTWLIILVLTLVLVIMRYVLFRKPRVANSLDAVNFALEDLQALTKASMTDKELLNRAALTTKRCLSSRMGQDLTPLTAQELVAFSAAYDKTPTSLLLQILIDIENDRFSPELKPNQAQKLVKDLINTLRTAQSHSEAKL